MRLHALRRPSPAFAAMLVLFACAYAALPPAHAQGSANPIRVLVWGEVEPGDAPITDFLRTSGYWAVGTDDPMALFYDFLDVQIGVDVLIIRAGSEQDIPDARYTGIWKFVTQAAGTVLVLDPNQTGTIPLFEDFTSPDLTVDVTSLSDPGAVGSIDAPTSCPAIGLSAGYFPAMTNNSPSASLGGGWTLIASQGANAALAVSEVGRGTAAYLASDLATPFSGREAFVTQLFNCVGREPAAVDDGTILLFQPDLGAFISTALRLNGLGVSHFATSDPADLVRSNLRNYAAVIIGRGQDPATGSYLTYSDDLVSYVRFDRGTVILESPEAAGSSGLFPSDAYGDYSLSFTGSLAGSGTSIATDRFAQTHELAASDLPPARTNVTAAGAAWRELIEVTSGGDPVLLWKEYYSGHFGYLGYRIDEFPVASANTNSNELLIRVLNQAMRPFRPLEDIAYMVADVEPTTLMAAIESEIPSIEKSTFVDVRSTNTSIVTLGKHDAVVAFSYEPWNSASSADGRLKDYVDRYARGTVVTGRSFDNGTGRELVGGGFSAYNPFNPLNEENVQYLDNASSADMGHNVLFGTTVGEVLAIKDRYRARVNVRNNPPFYPEGIAQWDNTPTDICTDSTQTFALGAGLAFDAASAVLIGVGIEEGVSTDYQFLSISPTENGGEPTALDFVPSPSGSTPGGLAIGGGYYWYADSTNSTLYRLTDINPTTVDLSVAVGYAPGDMGWDGSNVWVADPANDQLRWYDTGFVQQGTLSLATGAAALDGPSGLAVRDGGSDTLFVAGQRGTYEYNTIMVIADPTGSAAVVDSFPAVGYDCDGLAIESGERGPWSIYNGAPAPPFEGRNKVCRFSGDLPDLSAPVERFQPMIAVDTANKAAAFNFYPGESDNELRDGASLGTVYELMANALRQVSIHPKGDDPEIRLGDHPQTVKRDDVLAFHISLFNSSASAVGFNFRLRLTTPGGGETTVLPYNDPVFSIPAWERRSGKVLLYVPEGTTEGAWRATAYTRDDGSTIWNDHESVEIAVSGDVSFPPGYGVSADDRGREPSENASSPLLRIERQLLAKSGPLATVPGKAEMRRLRRALERSRETGVPFMTLVLGESQKE